jgi:hypothetical protein
MGVGATLTDEKPIASFNALIRAGSFAITKMKRAEYAK